MKKTVFSLAALGLTTACVLPPKDVSKEELAAFDAAVISIGCDLVGESDYQPVELQTGLTREKLVEVAQYRIATEEAVQLENGGVRLQTGSCAPEPAPETQA